MVNDGRPAQRLYAYSLTVLPTPADWGSRLWRPVTGFWTALMIGSLLLKRY